MRRVLCLYGPCGPLELSQGFRSMTPVGLKATKLRVTTVMPWTSAVAAINPSRIGRGSGTWRAAARCATAISTGRMRPAKAGRTCPSSHVAGWPLEKDRGAHPARCRSSSYWMMMTERKRLTAGTPRTQLATLGSAFPALTFRSSETASAVSRHRDPAWAQ